MTAQGKTAALSARMLAVAGLVPAGYIAADIGCDHGYVPLYLVSHGICPHVYAADVRMGPLERAREHIALAGVEDRITPVLSDGLMRVPVGNGGAQAMIAAGMGGRLIVRILSDRPDKAAALKWLILEPQSEVWLVRGWLMEHGFAITAEDMVFEDGKFYPVIQAAHVEEEGEAIRPLVWRAAKRQERLLEEMEAQGFTSAEKKDALTRFGPQLLWNRPPVFSAFLEHTIEKNAALTEQLTGACRAAWDGGGKERLWQRQRQLLQEGELAKKVRCFLQDFAAEEGTAK